MTMVKKCPECGGINLFLNSKKGEVICKDCGLVIEDKMVDFGQEWREFSSDSDAKKRRTGAPMTYTQLITLLPEMQLPTIASITHWWTYFNLHIIIFHI